MKKFAAILLSTALVMTLFSGCGGAQGGDSSASDDRLEKILAEGKLTISTSPDFAPYEFMNPGKSGQEAIVGSDMAMARYIAEQLGVELHIESMGFDAALAAVQEGKVDAVISGLAWKEDRSKVMMLSDYFNLGGHQGVMVRTEDLDKYKAAADFSGITIGAQNASLQYENVINQLPEAKVEVVATVSDGIMMLQQGKIDALAMSGVTGDQYAKNYEDVSMCEFQFETDSEGNVLGVQNGQQALYDKMNEIIKDINDNGLYDQWLEEATELSNTIMGE